MREYVNIAGLSALDIGDSLFGELAALPDSVTIRTTWQLRLPKDHPSVVQALSILDSHGFSRWIDTSHPLERGRQYLFSIIREYDASDFASAPLVELRALLEGEHIWRSDKNSRAEVQRLSDIRRKDRFIVAGACQQMLLVSDDVRRLLESGLQAPEIEFYPVDMQSRTSGTGPSTALAPWWELSSSVVLPLVSPVMQLKDFFGHRKERGYTGSVQILEDHFVPRELHYIRTELDAAGPFDLACTHERYSHHERDRWLIASQRFYRFCVENDIRCDWIPVRIDER